MQRKLPRLTDRKALFERAMKKRFPDSSDRPILNAKQKMGIIWAQAIIESIREDPGIVLVKQLGAKNLKRLGFGISFLQEYFNPRKLIEIGFGREDFLSRGCGFLANNYRWAKVTPRELVEKLKFTEADLLKIGFDQDEIREAIQGK